MVIRVIKTKMATSMKLQSTCLYRLWPTYTISGRVLHTKLATRTIREYTLNDNFAYKRLPVSLVSHRGSAPRLSLPAGRSSPAIRSTARSVCTFPGSMPGLLSAEKFVNLPVSSSVTSLMTQSSRNWGQARAFSSGSGNDEFSSASSSSASDDGGEGDGSGGEDDSAVPDVTVGADLSPSMVALSPMTVPEVWPRVPVIAVRRHPLFPRFIKMIEVFTLPILLSLCVKFLIYCMPLVIYCMRFVHLSIIMIMVD